jgi:serine/threonine protein kinase
VEAALDRTLTQPASGPAARPASGLESGQQLGHFRVERQLGAGGMGEVYLATDLALDRPVAIKVLPEALARDPARRERLIREARAQARVVHPNVGHIYFIGEERGFLFVAMEYVPGETLAQRAAKAPMSIDAALAAIRGAALGLREASRAGFLHRDVKPSNLMLDAHDTLKVLDFGLAASAPDGERISGPIDQTSLVGTPLYMSPEQARGEPLDARSDIYALGATLYHIVSGRPPFEANTADELRDLHASAPRPKVPPGVTPKTALAIGDLCARMMAARAEDRFASYDELIAAIDTLQTSRTRPAGGWVRLFAAGLDVVPLFVVYGVLWGLVIVALRSTPPGFSLLWFVAICAYQAWCVRRWGRSWGKAVFELEVVRASDGGRPSWSQALRRPAVLCSVPALGDLVANVLSVLGVQNRYGGGLTLLAYTATIIVLFVSTARSHGKRTPWDVLSGTLVRYRIALPPR